jgi:alkylated DNA nucleotide flippase Atl1
MHNWPFAMFGYALWAIPQGLVMGYGHSALLITTARNNTTVFKNLPHSLKGE